MAADKEYTLVSIDVDSESISSSVRNLASQEDAEFSPSPPDSAEIPSMSGHISRREAHETNYSSGEESDVSEEARVRYVNLHGYSGTSE